MMNNWANVLKINKNNISNDIFCYHDCNLSKNCNYIHLLSNFNNYYFLNIYNRNIYNRLLDLNILKCLKNKNNYFFSKEYINLYPIFTLPDGNCLFHAIAIQMYGVPDLNLDLKKLLLHFFQSNKYKNKIKEYWNIEMTRSYKILNIELNQNIIDTEWKYELKCIFSKDGHQGLLSIFLLSHIIRRAIIIVSSFENELEGVYLPFLIDFKLYNKNPVFIYYHNNHFTSLMCMKNNNNDFILSNKPLKIHFYNNNQDDDYLALWFHNYRKTDNYIISSLI